MLSYITKKGCDYVDIFSEIKKLPNLGYDYCKDNGQFCFVVLGGSSCPPTDEYRFYETARHYSCKLHELYEKKPFSEETKEAIAYCMNKIRAACDARKPGTHTLTQQAAYIDTLSDTEREQIEEQVLMYIECNQIYVDSWRKR